MRSTHDILVETRAALPALTASRERKNTALAAIADRLLAEQDSILAANRLDIEASRDKYGSVMIDRLTLTPERIAGMAQGVREVAALPDPEGQVIRRVERPNGLVIEKTSVPLGVVAERHLRRGSAGAEVRQCRYSARRKRSLPLQCGHSTGNPSRAGGCRASGGSRRFY